MELTLLYRDEVLVAVTKPPGLLVHRTSLDRHAEDFLLQRLRRLLGQRVYTVHRLDRPTSGVMVFALDLDTARALSACFEQRQVQKSYLAVVRGYTDPSGHIDYPLREHAEAPLREAITDYQCLAQVELPIAMGRYASSRYSLLRVLPRTGRYHQIRRHFHHIFHPLIGDTTHGEGRHNRLFREQFGIQRLLLHAHSLGFEHPVEGRHLVIWAPLDAAWQALHQALGWPTQIDAQPAIFGYGEGQSSQEDTAP